jgi:hypothetical protein
MALPTAYLTTTKNLSGILSAIQNGEAPPKFTQVFLSDLGYKSSSDRLIIDVLKAVGFLNPDGVPTDRYFRYLDQTQAGSVLAEGLREAYADLHQVNKSAHTLNRNELKNKLKTLTRGRYKDSVLDKMAMTFVALSKHADFSTVPTNGAGAEEADEDGVETPDEDLYRGVKLGGLVYTIQIQLPESRDSAVYDALFRSLKSHLLQ